MKKIILANLLAIFSILASFATTPSTISYQAIVRNSFGEVIVQSPIGVKINILQGGENGPSIYSEERITPSNENGLISFEIGDNETSALADIDWSQGPYFLQCDIDLQGGSNYTLTITKPITSVPYALYAERISPNALPTWMDRESKPSYNYSEIIDAPTAITLISQLENDAAFITAKELPVIPTKLSELQNDPKYITLADLPQQDSSFLLSAAYNITESDIEKWNQSLATENDPTFSASAASKITLSDVQAWNSKIFQENDPLFAQSVAAQITTADTAKWNKKIATESDPAFKASPAAKITPSDVQAWNSKIASESDPKFSQSVAAKITAADTAQWNKKLATESDPTFAASTAAKITPSDVQAWNSKIASESDPKFSQSVAAKITAADTAKWNKKVTTESDPSFKASPASKITLSDIQNWDNKVAIESDPQFAISPAAQITPTDIQSWNSKVTNEQDPLFSQSPAAQIRQSDIQGWNNKISTENDPLFLNSLAYKITATDTARWGKRTVLPQNVSYFTNDAKYITENDAKEMAQQLSTLSSQIETLINNNQRLSQRIDSLNDVVNRLPSMLTTSYGKAAYNSYNFSTTGWNYGPDLYYGLKEGDRIIYIIRHSERDENCSGKECDLNSNGVTLAKNVGKNYVGGKADANQSYYYGSTDYPRCKNTSYLIAINRGDTELSSKEAVNNPIHVIDQKYIVGSESNWDNIAKFYQEHPVQTDESATIMINTLCNLTKEKTFSLFTSHDFLTVPLCGWASNGGLNFARPNWMNFMSGIAVIVHPNGSWEVYPVRNLENGYGTVSWYK